MWFLPLIRGERASLVGFFVTLHAHDDGAGLLGKTTVSWILHFSFSKQCYCQPMPRSKKANVWSDRHKSKGEKLSCLSPAPLKAAHTPQSRAGRSDSRASRQHTVKLDNKSQYNSTLFSPPRWHAFFSSTLSSRENSTSFFSIVETAEIRRR